MNDTIFALSSGSPPAAIAIVRISGEEAAKALEVLLAGERPQPRRASVRRLADGDNATLDHALVLWFPGPATATGEDLVELHLHGGRAVITAVENALGAIPGLRRAEPGEFTRRAFANGRIDLAEAEGLADLLTAETELQRRQAIALASGALSSQIARWRDDVLSLSAQLEAVLDFGGEDDVEDIPPSFAGLLQDLAGEIRTLLEGPRSEKLREGFRVVLAGPPNAGKSSLFNRLIEDEAAITAPRPGTTRDVLTRPIAIRGVPFVFADTAGLREDTDDSIEAIGIQRAMGEVAGADLVLWLGPEGEGSGNVIWEIESFADTGTKSKGGARHRVSAITGVGLDALRDDLVQLASQAMVKPGSLAVNQRQHDLLEVACEALNQSKNVTDQLLVGECLRSARVALDRLLGRSAAEDMLDALFRRFCIGK
ncbi:tRNA uridine-5-carboxymethylaminomethyl(34) synthesis GTPase MnmE [Novosphingobium sp. RD2P27]|uniref:tRNA modification GTPase MnmE n=1 Tax=Novosphingobium kalidii TaxID=3230299 RepID=A0ABV2D4W5_9SPHN